jgi:kynurenine formamidase
MANPNNNSAPHAAIDRRQAVQGVAAGISVAVAASPAQAQDANGHPTSHADFLRLRSELSNWGRWGADDQMGSVNLITPAKRKQALALAREGVSYSMARNAEMQTAVDNPQPIIRKILRAGAAAPAVGNGGTADSFFIAYHGYAHTHMDTLCHFLWDGKMYNGYSKDLVTEENGAEKNSILNYKHGIITRGVLMDMARLKGVDYLEPGTPIYPEDLDAWEKKANVRVRAGDVMIVRTGRWARRDAKGAWPVSEGLAGMHMSCAKWLHERDIAVIGGDGAQDVLPSRVEGIAQPIHSLCIVTMGTPIFDNLDLELVGREAEKRKRWEFLVTASPAAVPGGTGSVLNPIATF